MSDNYYYEDDEEGYDDDYYEDDEEGYDDEMDDDDGPCSPMRCGECWGGDGICMEVVYALSESQKTFEETYVATEIQCGCGKRFTQYTIPSDELWVWPGNWPDGNYYSPMIALDIFAFYDAPKGEVHEREQLEDGTQRCHIWVGTGELRSEKLIRLSSRAPVDKRMEEADEAYG